VEADLLLLDRLAVDRLAVDRLAVDRLAVDRLRRVTAAAISSVGGLWFTLSRWETMVTRQRPRATRRSAGEPGPSDT